MLVQDVLPDHLRHPRFSDFDVAQLRSLVFAYQKSPENIPRSKSELLKLLESFQGSELNNLLAKLELTQAYKHAYLFRISEVASKRIGTTTLEKWFANYKDQRFGATNLYPLDYQIGEYISIRLVQPVINYVFEQVVGNKFELNPRIYRHAVIVAIKPRLGLIEVRFDGFEQAKNTPTPERVDYEAIANDCRNMVGSMVSEEPEGLQLRQSVEKAIKAHSSEVAPTGIKSKFMYGTISIDADESAEGDLKSYMADAFGVAPSMDVTDPWTNKNIMLKWPQLKMATRINFIGETSDILFMWRRGSSKALSSTDHIIKRLVENAETWAGDAIRRLEDTLQNMKSWRIVTPADVAQKANVAMPVALEFLLEKTVADAADLMYRFKTESVLLNSDNAWVNNLGQLPLEVTTERGEIINQLDPKNIEVGFMIGEVK
jgi:hypothetical protein